MRRAALIGIVAAAGGVLAGCSSPPPPEVTFYADGETVNASPQVYCPPAEECWRDDSAVAELSIRPGRTVQISVPSEVADEPWGVIYSYLDATGQRVDASSRIFFPKDGRVAFTLEMATPGDKLLLANVTRLSATEGKLEPSALWTLRATD